ncbi:hypothetical protein [uncultured Limosilactobacillus sp.]|uniref:hypothetical protein n=1 Tax=uncultured Limosilactobacillus sp. TaxID=2837629 RepID=UPI002583E34E|nr:hypothetical protein [uncultured Limosilactobacillus sp.]
MSKLINSKITALIMGSWVTYCIGIGVLSGALFLALMYVFLIADDHLCRQNKKAINDAKLGDSATVND